MEVARPSADRGLTLDEQGPNLQGANVRRERLQRLAAYTDSEVRAHVRHEVLSHLRGSRHAALAERDQSKARILDRTEGEHDDRVTADWNLRLAGHLNAGDAQSPTFVDRAARWDPLHCGHGRR